MGDSHHNSFGLLLASSAVLRQTIKDIFFAERLDVKINILISGYIQFEISRRGDNVAQYYNKYCSLIRLFDEYLEEIRHLNLADMRPLLTTRELLFHHQLEILRSIELKAAIAIETESNQQKPISEFPLVVDLPYPTVDNKKPESNHDKILEFVKRSRKVRAKEIVGQFSALSERTVKRRLQILVQSGQLKKHAEAGGAMYYSIS